MNKSISLVIHLRIYKAVLSRSLCLLTVVCCTQLLNAQQAMDDSLLQWRAGVGVNYALNAHRSSLSALPGVPSCAPLIHDGSGSGMGVNAFFALPLQSGLMLSLGLEYAQQGGRLSTTQKQIVDDKGAREASIEYSIETALSTLSVRPELQYSIRPFVLHAGVEAGIIAGSHYQQVERILSPSTIVFENGQRDRMNFSGPIEQLSSVFGGVCVGISSSLDVDADKTLALEPKVSYEYMLSNLLATPDPWKVNRFTFGVALRYAHYREVQKPIPVEPPPPPKPEVPQPVAEIPKQKLLFPKLKFAPRLRDTNNVEMALQFVIRNTISQNTYAMINYVFFDSASSRLPSRYELLAKEDIENFNAVNLNATSTMQIYYNILNLVGFRMRQDQKSRIALVGCNSGDGAEKNNLSLSKSRAESVKSYLCGNWGIEPSRISISARNLPETASNSSTTDGIEENRRVEIRTETTELLEPLIFSDTTCTLNAAKVLYPGGVNSEITVSSWLLTVMSDGKLITTLGDRGTPPNEIVWDTEIDRERIQQVKGSLTASLKVVDTEGNEYKAESDAMEVKQQRVRNSTIQRFSLITFAFNASNVSKADRHIINIIKQNILPKSTVYVTGYTDRVGDADHNQQLSQQRAQQVAKLLNVKIENAKGEGAGNGLYDNSTPEGRFYSRTVIVTIETPLD